MSAQAAPLCGHEYSIGGIAYRCQREPHPVDGQGPAFRHAAAIDFEQAEGTDQDDGFGTADLMTWGEDKWAEDEAGDGQDPEIAWGTVAGYAAETTQPR